MAVACDLCKRDTTRLLCDVCTEAMRRLVRTDERMHTRELCEAERLAQKTENK